jgi:hypothetical protein
MLPMLPSTEQYVSMNSILRQMWHFTTEILFQVGMHKTGYEAISCTKDNNHHPKKGKKTDTTAIRTLSVILLIIITLSVSLFA